MERIIKLIETYEAKRKAAHGEYCRAEKDIRKKYDFGKLQAYRSILDDLRALTESNTEEQANELLPPVTLCNHLPHADTTHKNGFYQCNICNGLIRVIER